MHQHDIKVEQETCRLCTGSLVEKFSLKVLQTYDVSYYECATCLSLQTENPYWLSKAYDCNLSSLDTGAIQRNLNNFAACSVICKTLNLNNILDFGGGDGLLCRLLRDYEYNAYVMDKYAHPTYAQGFTQPNFEYPDLLVSFEVFEHFVHPKEEIAKLFAFRPKALLISTALYDKQNQDWWYLGSDAGQHVFFYSEKAIENIAQTYGYEAVLSGGYILFVRSDYLGFESSFYKRKWIEFLLKGKVLNLAKLAFQWSPPKGVWKDFEHIKSHRVKVHETQVSSSDRSLS